MSESINILDEIHDAAAVLGIVQVTLIDFENLPPSAGNLRGLEVLLSAEIERLRRSERA